jgi:hypothetical protein
MSLPAPSEMVLEKTAKFSLILRFSSCYIDGNDIHISNNIPKFLYSVGLYDIGPTDIGILLYYSLPFTFLALVVLYNEQ